jgi:hypothetical protein
MHWIAALVKNGSSEYLTYAICPQTIVRQKGQRQAPPFSDFHL